MYANGWSMCHENRIDDIGKCGVSLFFLVLVELLPAGDGIFLVLVTCINYSTQKFTWFTKFMSVIVFWGVKSYEIPFLIE